MFTIIQLDNAFNSAIGIVNFKGGFDAFKFRKGFEEDTTISIAEKEEILAYLETKIPKSSMTYLIVKERINQQEFLSTDYYANPHPRKFRGAYAPVVLKTFAGIMLIK
ncbi:hypothetical protein RCG19_10420 [Neobacillus sp. OS1-2]|uniref:hypothetical protein n=1 Tax=Neobacillus sp. OS1-2 TaxID=3070680 RepID=UPI0027E096C5|nr:hypothetical protein [Neobacillus sp. OS1-2]WML41996.1 hypothetical protein RCG19_10420 [Neobacillus sp. OS1-2]